MYRSLSDTSLAVSATLTLASFFPLGSEVCMVSVKSSAAQWLYYSAGLGSFIRLGASLHIPLPPSKSCLILHLYACSVKGLFILLSGKYLLISS